MLTSTSTLLSLLVLPSVYAIMEDMGFVRLASSDPVKSLKAS
jgi:hypothetical protein